MKKTLLPLALALTLCVFAAESRTAEKPFFVGISEQRLRENFNCVEDTYAEAFIKAGFTPIVIPCTSNETVLAAILDRVDLLVMTGGADVNPARYRTAKSPNCGEPDFIRDEFEFRLVAAARRRRLPIVGVCRGCQLVNVAFGGTLWQDLPSEFTNRVEGVSHGFGSYYKPADFPSAHTVVPVPGTRFAAAIGTAALAVNSHHHQAVKEIAPGFVVAARSPDGVIEAIESTDYPAFAVQFHPETLVARAQFSKAYDYERLLKLIRSFPALCRPNQPE